MFSLGVRRALIISTFLALPLVTTVDYSGQAFAQVSGFDAVCRVTSGTSGKHKFATIKCHRASQPGVYKIRTTIWESKDKKGYRSLAKMAGRRFTCTMVKAGSNSSRESINTNYELTNCRR